MTQDIKTCYDCKNHEKLYRRRGGKNYHGEYPLLTSFVYCKCVKSVSNTLYAEDCPEFDRDLSSSKK